MDESVIRHLQRPANLAPWRTAMLDAADHIEEHGLYQGGELSDGDRHCTIGTLKYVCHGDPWGRFRGTPAEQAWNVLRPIVGGLVSDWSDKTPQSEVVATLRRVALGGLS